MPSLALNYIARMEVTEINKSSISKSVMAAAGEFKPLAIGPLNIWPPVVLAPMAGITNAPFRTLCRQFGAGLFVSEMVTARLLAKGDPYTLKLASFAPGETPRSLQLYEVDPHYLGEAAAQLADQDKIDHLDLNFGCPMRKITRKGGGAAIPLKPNLFRKLVRTAVTNAAHIPVTVKFRMGISDNYLTYLTAGKIAEEEGCAAVALHARTAAQLYASVARWEAIAELKQAVTTIPVLGNGDIWEAADALRMMHLTGCDGVVVGRGCLGRPWLFRDLQDAFEGRRPQTPPTLGEVAEIMIYHARLLCDWLDEKIAMRTFRKHCKWYVKGFPGEHRMAGKLMRVETLAELEQILAGVNADETIPTVKSHLPRGKSGRSQKVVLPEGYLDHLEDDSPPTADAAEALSGG